MKKRMIKINLKSESGFTLADLVATLTIFLLFITVISGLMYSSFNTNLEVKMSAASTYYAMQILEDIDKIPYENVENGMESKYIDKFSIPSGFSINIDVSNYNEENDKEDLIKKIKLTITYELYKEKESIVINRIKVKEL